MPPQIPNLQDEPCHIPIIIQVISSGNIPKKYAPIISVKPKLLATGFALLSWSSLTYCEVNIKFTDVSRDKEWYDIKTFYSAIHC